MIDAVSGIGAAGALDTEVDSLDLDNTTSGNVDLAETDAVSIQQILQGADDSITVTAGGTITVTSGGNGVVIDDTGDANGNGVITLTSTAGGVAVDAAVRNDSNGATANIVLDAQGTNSDVALTALVIGSALLSLSAFWTPIRNKVVAGLPNEWKARVPVAGVVAG